MFWTLEVREAPEEAPDTPPADGRFVLHRHHDAEGAHLDLRLESDGCLVGYRIGGDALEDGAWATEKMPHPVSWLDEDGDAVREDSGVFVWRHRGADSRELELHGGAGVQVLRVNKARSLDAGSARSIAEALDREEVEASRAGALIRDGALARRRAIERFCGLGRELDGRAFDEGVWRSTMRGLSLEEIQRHLHGLEVRFDAKYPPSPVSAPEPLEDEDEWDDGGASVLALARG